MIYLCIVDTNHTGADFGFDGVQGRHVSMSGHVTTPANRVTKI